MAKKLDLDFYSKSLFLEVSKVLGAEFSRLPERIQTGYVKVFEYHSGIIRHNQHKKLPDSFAMGEDEVKRYFTDRKNFRSVNDTGYWLKPKSNRYGLLDEKYILKRKKEKGAKEYPPTKWVIKTIRSSQNDGKGTGYHNGYKLSPKIIDLVNAWHAKTAEELGDDVGLINHKGQSILEVSNNLGGAISRDKSSTPKEVNVSLLVNIDTFALAQHKRQVQTAKIWMEIKKVDTLVYKSKEWKEVYARVVTNEEKARARTGREAKRALGGVNRELPLQSLLSKDFTLEGLQQRLIEINTLQLKAREMKNSSIPVIYKEVSTGRYTSKEALLQGYHRSVRYAALKGCYEYDLEAAHQNILIQLLDQQGNSFAELDVVREYVAKKKQVRKRLAKELMTSVEVVKEIIQELTYGAKLNRSPKQSVYKTCKGDKNLLNRVCNNDWLKQLTTTFKLAHKYIIGDNKEIVSVVGIKSERDGEARELAHILQGYERLVLDVIIEHSNRKDIALLVHDCVVFYNKQSREELTRIVKENTGFELQFSEKQY
jgi:hypothetical protein